MRIAGKIAAPFVSWCRDTAGIAVAEFALIFPILMLLLLGAYEVGSAVAVNQKAIAASQIVADLVSRQTSVDDDALDEAVRAGQLALAPYDTADMGVDIVSLSFDSQNNAQIVWRETRNMEPDENAVNRADTLGTSGDGVLLVTVNYHYRPSIGRGVVDEINMKETTYTRGRRTAVVSRDEDGE